MAVQQNKKSPSKRGMRRAHDFLTEPSIGTDESGQAVRSHHIGPNGMYRGKKVLKTKDE